MPEVIPISLLNVTMVFLIGSKHDVLFFSKAFNMKDYTLKKKSLWALFNKKATSVKCEVCLSHSKG